MRIDATSIQSLVSTLDGLNTQQAGISSQLSSGVRLNALSDDPVTAGQAASLADSLRQDTAFLSTSSTANNRLQAADSALGSVVTQITSAISTAVGAFNNTSTPTQRAAAASQLQSLRNSIVSVANSSYSGGFLFAGSATVQPFTEDTLGNLTYHGDNNPTQVPLASGGTVQGSLAGSSVFTASGASVFGALDAVISELTTNSSTGGTTASALVGGLQSALTNVTSQRSVINTAQNRLSGESDYITAQKTNLSVQQTTLLSADYASLATELSAVTTQRSALLSTISIVQKGSLFDYLH